MDWDGDLIGAQVGADVRLHSRLLVGTAMSWHRGGFDWSEGPVSEVVSGEYDVEMTGVHPYAGWTSRGGRLGVWGTLGYGWGSVEVESDALSEVAHSDSDLLHAAWGVTGQLLSNAALLPGGETTLRAKGEVSLMRWDVEGSALVAPLKVDTERLRMALELSHRRALEDGELTPMLELGVRHDSGHGGNATGLEVGAGLRYLLAELELTMEGRVRALALSGSDYEEWGGELNMTLDPGLNREGLRMRVMNGGAASRLRQLGPACAPPGLAARAAGHADGGPTADWAAWQRPASGTR